MFRFNFRWNILEEGGSVAVRGAERELLQLGGKLGEVDVVVSVEAGVDVVRHVAGAVVQVC